MTRKIIEERIPLDVHSTPGFDNDIDDLENFLDIVIESLLNARKACKAAGYTDIKVAVNWRDYGEACSLDLHGHRKETKEESQRRLEKQRKERKRKKQKQEGQDTKDRAEYDRLKAKFGGEQANV